MHQIKILLLLVMLLFMISFPAYANVSAGLEWRYQDEDNSYSLNTVKIAADVTQHWMLQTSYDEDNKDLAGDVLYRTRAGSRIQPYLGLGVRDLLQKSDSQLSVGERLEVIAGVALNVGPNPKTGLFLNMEVKAVPDTMFHDSNPDILKPTISLALNFRIPNYRFPKRRNKIKPPSSFDQKDVELLAKVVTAEAGDEPFEGQIAVAAVILNRLNSGDFPDTIPGVVYQNNQFKCVPKLPRITPSDSSYQATIAALNGQDPSYGALYYYNPKLSSPEGLKFFQTANLKVTARIGHHIFLTDGDR
ncbi:MAG TPA: hypothetical protein DDW50_04600 [Firmicutes bacterium]|jgi:hypothetical protein|nr:hypothetical protein [Bacillota bacterium]